MDDVKRIYLSYECGLRQSGIWPDCNPEMEVPFLLERIVSSIEGELRGGIGKRSIRRA